MSGNLHVVATLHAQAGKEEELQTLLEGLLEPTRAEDGCVRYQLLRNEADPSEFTFVEEWVSAEALASHFETEHIQTTRAKFDGVLAGELDLRRYRLVG